MTTEKQRVGLRGRKLHGKMLTFRLDAQDSELRARAKDAAGPFRARSDTRLKVKLS